MKPLNYQNRQKQWEIFANWETNQRETSSFAQALHQVGELADLYFKRHGINQNFVGFEHVQGIMKMHQLLGQGTLKKRSDTGDENLFGLNSQDIRIKCLRKS